MKFFLFIQFYGESNTALKVSPLLNKQKTLRLHYFLRLRPAYLRTVSQRKGKYEKSSESHSSFFYWFSWNLYLKHTYWFSEITWQFFYFWLILWRKTWLWQYKRLTENFQDLVRIPQSFLILLGQICLTLTCV